ncbi:MAG: hypothetical protein Kow00127_21670 [Bacteroidales bacterium]
MEWSGQRIFEVTGFSAGHSSLLIFALVLLGGSLFYHIKNRDLISVILLSGAAFALFCFAALLDPFLNLWDERFHALVAKNLMHHPLMPTLYDDPVVDMAYDRWDRYHVWLHKQPLFLWQIALSFRLFGVSLFTLRLPGVILMTLMVPAIRRTGKLLVDRDTGIIASILFITSVWVTELVAGRQELEHNDTAFMAYITFSLWSLAEYNHSGKKRWVFLTGLFSGMAILCKWLTGLLVFAGWTSMNLLKRKGHLHTVKEMAPALLITLIVALPWQIYTLIRFPAESAEGIGFFSQHFTKALEGHKGDFFYHFRLFDDIYGAYTGWLIFPAIILFIYRSKDRALAGAFLIMAFLVYLFFSAAATKMPSFTTINMLIMVIILATVPAGLIQLFRKATRSPLPADILLMVVVVALAIWRYDIDSLREKHSLSYEVNHLSRRLAHNRQFFESLKLPPNSVLMNVNGRQYIDAMFYTGLPAYGFIPSPAQAEDLFDKGRIIALLVTENKPVPDYLKKSNKVILIENKLQGYY